MNTAINFGSLEECCWPEGGRSWRRGGGGGGGGVGVVAVRGVGGAVGGGGAEGAGAECEGVLDQVID
jgi:hypothetical protein